MRIEQLYSHLKQTLVLIERVRIEDFQQHLTDRERHPKLSLQVNPNPPDVTDFFKLRQLEESVNSTLEQLNLQLGQMYSDMYPEDDTLPTDLEEE